MGSCPCFTLISLFHSLWGAGLGIEGRDHNHMSYDCRPKWTLWGEGFSFPRIKFKMEHGRASTSVSCTFFPCDWASICCNCWSSYSGNLNIDSGINMSGFYCVHEPHNIYSYLLCNVSRQDHFNVAIKDLEIDKNLILSM